MLQHEVRVLMTRGVNGLYIYACDEELRNALDIYMNQKTIDRIRRFTEERDWDQFHSPANLAKSIMIEAGELLECFQWDDDDYDMEHVKEELADVLVYCQNMLDRLELDVDEIVNSKMDKNEAKYPIEKAKGNAIKYDEF